MTGQMFSKRTFTTNSNSQASTGRIGHVVSPKGVCTLGRSTETHQKGFELCFFLYQHEENAPGVFLTFLTWGPASTSAGKCLHLAPHECHWRNQTSLESPTLCCLTVQMGHCVKNFLRHQSGDQTRPTASKFLQPYMISLVMLHHNHCIQEALCY